MTDILANINMGPICFFLCLLMLFWLALRPLNPGANVFFTSDALFLAVFFGTIVSLRLQYYSWPEHYNFDEAQFIAGAMRLEQHPVFWRDVDCGSTGVLNIYPLFIPRFIFGNWNYFGERIFATFLQVLSLGFFIKSFSGKQQRVFARLACVAIFALLTWAPPTDFLYYNGESFPILLISIAIWLIATQRPKLPGVFIFGVLLGCLPYSKLQAVIMIFPLAFLFLCIFYSNTKAILTCIVGGILPSIILIGFLLVNNAFDDFIMRYVFSGAAYVAQSSRLSLSAILLPKYGGFNLWAIGAINIMIFCAWMPKFLHSAKLSQFFFWVVLGLGAALTVYVPGRGYAHYIYFLLLPLSGLLVTSMSRLQELVPERQTYPLFLTLWLAPLLLIMPFGVNVGKDAVALGPRAFARQIQDTKSVSKKSTMFVWGDMPTMFVNLGIPPATRDAVTIFAIEKGVHQQYYKDCTKYDLQHSPPDFIVEAGGAFDYLYKNPATTGIASWPWLSSFVTNNYECTLKTQYGNLYKRRQPAQP